MKITILGCGTSTGVPLLGCDCAVCLSKDPKNKRSRPSILVEQGETAVLIDTAPDFREQILQNGIRKIDAVLYTHDHADHVHGLDELRSFNYMQNRAMDIYSDVGTIHTIKQRFPYAFLDASHNWVIPCLVPHIIEPYKKFTIGEFEILPFEQEHGRTKSLGFRFGDFAYATDVNNFSDEAVEAMCGVDTLVIDSVGYKKLPTHFHLEETLAWIDKLAPRRAILTHMSHGFDYEKLHDELPENVEPAYDGMVLEV